uniref:Multifunctional fusion protein n=1 Tax=Bulboplastis apyrenoidosa TaxID=1070855 RepID=A0A1X9PTP9_9RHOD|nr:translation elongation factor Ts [Bulboplastis apyrenoidosa]ARO90849.1 translation elongation factor Ts [Bulboplastis apyrenoidosa]
MNKISAQMVKELRDKTGAGMMNCKRALENCNGNVNEAIQQLRQKGLMIADKKMSRATTEGLIESYIHPGSKLGVLLEINCETDFVARRSEFQELAKNIAMQIAASPSIKFVSKEDIPESFIQEEKEIELGKTDLENKPQDIKLKIIEGRIDKRLSELSLMDQNFIRDNTISVKELIQNNIALLGENIKVSRFERFTLGESL